MNIFKRKITDRVEERFQTALNLVKDLDRREFKRFVDGLTLAWQSYDRIKQVQTIDEKENSDILTAEKVLRAIPLDAMERVE